MLCLYCQQSPATANGFCPQCNAYAYDPPQRDPVAERDEWLASLPPMPYVIGETR